MRRTATAICLWVAIAPYMANAGLYHSAKYGLTVEYSPSFSGCTARPPLPNHGIMLVPKGEACQIDHGSRSVTINAEFNAVEADGVDGLARLICKMGIEARDPSLRISGEVRQCAADPDHPYQIIVVEQRRSGSNKDIWVNYTVTLTSDRGHFDSDKEYLRSIHINTG